MTRNAARPSEHSEPGPEVRNRDNRLKDRATLVLYRALMLLPYRARVRLAGWVGRNLMARASRFRRRIRAAVLHLFPELPEAEVARICTRVPENLARAGVEIISGAEFYAQTAESPTEGPGLAALEEARRQGRPALLLTAHFGNSAAALAVLKARGFQVATYYKPMPDPAINRHYIAAVEAYTAPLFPTGREGVGKMVRHLRSGGMLSISYDLDRPHGVMLDFLGKPAPTVLSMAEMALRYDALLVPVYGIRQPDGLTFRVIIEDPIPHGDPVAMTQAINDSLGRRVTQYKDQWLWWHQRWKTSPPAMPDRSEVE